MGDAWHSRMAACAAIILDEREIIMSSLKLEQLSVILNQHDHFKHDTSNMTLENSTLWQRTHSRLKVPIGLQRLMRTYFKVKYACPLQ